MKNQILSDLTDEDDYQMAQSAHCWWRSSANLEKCAKFKLRMNLPKITPRLKVLREMERLALIAPEGLNELRHKLVTYRSGDFWVPIGGIKKEDMDIPSENTILLVGFRNSGKSSLVNLMYSVLGRSGLVPFAQTSSGDASKDTTTFMTEHNVLRSMRSGFCVYDTRGFDYDRVWEGIEELSKWMTDGARHNQRCLRSGENAFGKDGSDATLCGSSSKFAKRRVNCVMVVANFAEIYRAFKAGDKRPLVALKELFCSPAMRKSNENPILILTHGEKLSAEDRLEGRLKICEFLGLSEATGVYDIVCLTEYGFLADESDPVTAYAISEAVYRALLISDRGHIPKRNFHDWALMWFSKLMCLLGTLFAYLGHVFSNLGKNGKLKV